MINDNDQRIKDKIEFFLTEGVTIHIQLKNKTFLNGILLKKIKDGVYWLNENKLGEIYLFLKDIYEIEVFEEREDER